MDTSQPRIRVGSPADVLAVVPHLLGFHPTDSFVVIGVRGDGDRVELGFRYDLPVEADPGAADAIATHAVTIIAHRGLAAVIGVGYGPGPRVTPVADAFAAAAARAGLRLTELLRAEGDRYWSYLCGNVRCCPPEGTFFDYRSHPAAALMTAAGLPAHRDRAARATALLPVAGGQAQAMDQALERAGKQARALVARAAQAGSRNQFRFVIEEGRRAVGDAIRAYRAGRKLTEPGDFAWLQVALAHLPVRDDAWARMDPEHREAHLTLWTDVVRHAAPPWVPAPAALLAFTAWQCGDGALANIALERALAANPRYSMALLLRDVLDAGVPPSQAWLPMTPEEVADSYDREDGPSPPAAPRQPPRGRRRGGKSSWSQQAC
jgi:Domain of unknown function (DUF4192)